ncbi:MAG: hypothetical protein RLZZ546_189 [Bacteroidota bacterium]|jgi:hypothetical protein
MSLFLQEKLSLPPMFSILNKSYPCIGLLWPNIRFHIFIGIFVAIFLMVFQPFGTEDWLTNYKILKLAGYGILSFLMPTLIFFLRNFLINKFHFEHKYKVKHEVIWLISILISIACVNCIYTSYLISTPLSLSLFGYAIFMVCAIGFFPVAVSIYVKYNKYLAMNEKEAKELDDLIINKSELETENSKESESVIKLVAENRKDNITLQAIDLLYIESSENYSNIVFMRSGKFEKILLRSTLKRLEEQIDNPSILRCHRSFIVNLKNVLHFSGNAQGYLMSITGTDTKIPVSRSYGPKILEKLKKKR